MCSTNSLKGACFFRSSTFSGSMWGVYWDGVHNGGILDCRFPGPYQGGPILIMTNNDMACFSPTQRNAQYIVIAGCEFRGGRVAATLRTLFFVPGAVTGPALVLLAIFMLTPGLSPFGPLLHALGYESFDAIVHPRVAAQLEEVRT